MEWRFGVHWFAYLIFLLLFVAVGTIIFLVLDIYQIKGLTAFLIFFFSIIVLFIPIAKYWHNTFLKKSKNIK